MRLSGLLVSIDVADAVQPRSQFGTARGLRPGGRESNEHEGGGSRTSLEFVTRSWSETSAPPSSRGASDTPSPPCPRRIPEQSNDQRSRGGLRWDMAQEDVTPQHPRRQLVVARPRFGATMPEKGRSSIFTVRRSIEPRSCVGHSTAEHHGRARSSAALVSTSCEFAK